MSTQAVQMGAPVNQMNLGQMEKMPNQPNMLNKDLPSDTFVKEGETEPKKKSKKGLLVGLGLAAGIAALAIAAKKGKLKGITGMFKKGAESETEKAATVAQNGQKKANDKLAQLKKEGEILKRKKHLSKGDLEVLGKISPSRKQAGAPFKIRSAYEKVQGAIKAYRSALDRGDKKVAGQIRSNIVGLLKEQGYSGNTDSIIDKLIDKQMQTEAIFAL